MLGNPVSLFLFPSFYLKLNNQLIASVERLPLTTGGAPIVVRGKNFRYIQLIIPRERDCHNVYITIKRLMSIGKCSCCMDLVIHHLMIHETTKTLRNTCLA